MTCQQDSITYLIAKASMVFITPATKSAVGCANVFVQRIDFLMTMTRTVSISAGQF